MVITQVPSAIIAKTQVIELIARSFLTDEIPSGFIGYTQGISAAKTKSLTVAPAFAEAGAACSVNQIDISAQWTSRDLIPRLLDGQFNHCFEDLCQDYTPAEKKTKADFMMDGIKASIRHGLFFQIWFSKLGHVSKPNSFGVFDGFFQKIKDGVTATTVKYTNFNSGTPLGTDQAYSGLKDMLGKLPKKYRKGAAKPIFLVTASIYANLQDTASQAALVAPRDLAGDCESGFTLCGYSIVEVSQWDEGFADATIYDQTATEQHFAILTVPKNLQWRGEGLKFLVREGGLDTAAQGMIVNEFKCYIDVNFALDEALVAGY